MIIENQLTSKRTKTLILMQMTTRDRTFDLARNRARSNDEIFIVISNPCPKQIRLRDEVGAP